MEILLIGLTIVNWVIYHKIFAVAYFDLGRGILKEIVACFLLAGLELALIMYAGGWLLGLLGGIVGFVGGVLGWIFQIAIWIVCIVLVICVIYWLYKLIKSPEKTKEDLKNFFDSTMKEENTDVKHGSTSDLDLAVAENKDMEMKEEL